MAEPTTNDWLNIAKGYFEKTQFPNTVDGKHIRIECPKSSESDCNVFKTSTFGKKLYGDKLNFPPEQCLPNDEFGSPQVTTIFVLVTDEAFALHNNLLRPFPGRTLNDKRRIFNYRSSRARQYIECTFGIMSKKWPVFQTNILVEPDAAVIITKGSSFMESVQRRGVGNIQKNAKDVREYFVEYVNNPNHALDWQNTIIGR
ncbi:unnamed protein product [Macrosiphum euphorbiae]|uniref:DDE Tnp4 domain-containing protein n=1 Tax=Macrosiphum euphorbiae TaxID=13131 RepID=A0AAV0WNW7_9HEMI|nr:unnamed protein product [Macrosiphum euphorbiae]